MAGQNFVDYVKVFFESGRGGAGSVHFRREKYVPNGGPDGGDGGQGGSIILRGNAQLWTLLSLKWTKHVKAESGGNGGGNNRHGTDGKDVIIDVPLGTVAKDFETGEVLFEIIEDQETQVLFKGGRGGKGNSFFKSATNQVPRYAQPGEDNEEGWIILELKVLADVGLVGFPNAGKSTLLSVLSAAKPKIANYPFTTLTPNLGMVSYRDNRSFIIADIPGIIEKAHEGKGLGARFLKHIERNAVLLFMIPADSENIKKDYQILLNELKMFNPELMDKPKLLAITKTDLIDDELEKMLQEELPEGIDTIFISSIAHKGLEALKDRLWVAINEG